MKLVEYVNSMRPDDAAHNELPHLDLEVSIGNLDEAYFGNLQI